jgi:hypothetical protein
MPKETRPSLAILGWRTSYCSRCYSSYLCSILLLTHGEMSQEKESGLTALLRDLPHDSADHRTPRTSAKKSPKPLAKWFGIQFHTLPWTEISSDWNKK